MNFRRSISISYNTSIIHNARLSVFKDLEVFSLYRSISDLHSLYPFQQAFSTIFWGVTLPLSYEDLVYSSLAEAFSRFAPCGNFNFDRFVHLSVNFCKTYYKFFHTNGT